MVRVLPFFVIAGTVFLQLHKITNLYLVLFVVACAGNYNFLFNDSSKPKILLPKITKPRNAYTDQ